MEQLLGKTFSTKDYFRHNSYSVMNNAKFLSWRHYHYITLSDCSYEWGNKRLLSENLGSPNFHLIIDDKIWACWPIEYNSMIFLIFGYKNKTKYEIIYKGTESKFTADTATGDIIINFHYWLLRNIFDVTLHKY